MADNSGNSIPMVGVNIPEDPWVTAVRAEFRERFGEGFQRVLDAIEELENEVSVAEMGAHINTQPLDLEDIKRRFDLPESDTPPRRVEALRRAASNGEAGLVQATLLGRLGSNRQDILQSRRRLEGTLLDFAADRAPAEEPVVERQKLDTPISRRSFFSKVFFVDS